SFDNLCVAADRRETIGAAESCDASGSLSHRICHKRDAGYVRLRVIRGWRSLDQSHQQVFRPSDLAVDLDGQPRGNRCSLCGTTSSLLSNDRRNELVKREDRRCRKPGKHDNWPATSGRQANGLAGLQCDTMGDDAWISKFSDCAIRQVARPLAGASGEQHDIGGAYSAMKAFAQFREIVAGDAEPQRLAAQLTNCIGE